MRIDDQLLSKLEKLSSLNIHESKKAKMEENLSDILGFVENLNQLDVSGIEATFTTLNGGTPLRNDEIVSDSSIPEIVLANAPAVDKNMFLVQKIIE